MTGDGQQARAIVVTLRGLLAAAPELQQAMGRRMELPPGDVAALDAIVRAGETIGPGELARRLAITTASATVMVDRLEGRGHLVRQPHERDRRRVDLHVTDSARVEIGHTLRPLTGRLAELANSLDPADAAVVLGFLEAATEVLYDYARHDPGVSQHEHERGV